MVGWLVGWLVGGLVDWLVGWSFGPCHLIFFAYFAVLRLAETNYSFCSTARDFDSRVYGLVLICVIRRGIKRCAYHGVLFCSFSLA